MTGISNWFEFQWPVEGKFSGFGDKQFRPNPSISTSTNPNSKWIIPILSTNQNNNFQNEIAELNRLTKDKIKEELERRSLFYDEKENQQELIAILRENIACETINKIAEARKAIGTVENKENNNITELRMKKGKTKKKKREKKTKNQEYGKKGGRKHIPEGIMELLKGFFHAGELEENDIPKLKTIENWISQYSRQHKQAMAKAMAK
ncbi:13879_t:CDS:2 [Funneliformis geosporum]|nr:13879_t:CDS:2 [Funneliformis geosporum]